MSARRPPSGAWPPGGETRRGSQARRAAAASSRRSAEPDPLLVATAAARERGGEAFEVGALVGGHRLLEQIGRGSMGRVYRALDPLGREVAFKVVSGAGADAEGRLRFQREGEALAAIPPHPNVVRVHSAGALGGVPYLAMDYVPGESLQAMFRRGPLPVADAVAMVRGLADALEHVHRAGVLHRDIKPGNVLVRQSDGAPVLTDFGMAGLRGAERLTRTGDLLGTPLYMSPEQILGLRDVDGRSDVWALGVILYEALAGFPPFGGRSLVEVTEGITSGQPPALTGLRQDLDPVLLGIVARALSKPREERFPTPAALRDALLAWERGRAGSAEHQPGPARSGVSVLLAAALLSGVLCGALLWFWQRSGQPSPAPLASAAPAPQASLPAAQPPRVVDPALAARADFLVELAERGDVPALARVLDELAPRLREEPALDARLRQARQSLAGRALALAGQPRPGAGQLEQLCQALRLLGRLDEARSPAGAVELDRYATAVSCWASALWRLPDGDPLQALADLTLARLDGWLRPGAWPVDQLPLLVDVWDAYASAHLPRQPGRLQRTLELFWQSWDLSAMAAPTGDGVLTSPIYWRILHAAARLDVELHTDHFRANTLRRLDLSSCPYKPEQGPVEAYLVLRSNLDARQRTGQGASPARLEEWRRQLLELAASPEAWQALGPVTHAWALLSGSEALPPQRRLPLLQQAAALHPECPWILLVLAETLRASLPPGALEPMTISQRALERFVRLGYDELLSTGWETSRMVEGAFHGALHARAWEPALALLERSIELRGNHPEDAVSLALHLLVAEVGAGELALAETHLGLLETLAGRADRGLDPQTERQIEGMLQTRDRLVLELVAALLKRGDLQRARGVVTAYPGWRRPDPEVLSRLQGLLPS